LSQRAVRCERCECKFPIVIAAATKTPPEGGALVSGVPECSVNCTMLRGGLDLLHRRRSQ